MSVSRPTITQILEKAFLQTPGLYEKCRAKTKERIEAGDFVGFFNDYPPLMCAEDIKKLSDRYIHLLRGIMEVPGHLSLPNDIVKRIEELTLEIAISGVTEVLDANGNVNAGLLNLLNLSNYTEKLKGQGAHIVKSYLGMVVGDVNESTALYGNKYQTARAIASNCISRRSNGIIHKALQYHDRNSPLSWVSIKADMVVDYAMKHQKETAVVAAASAIVLFGLFGGGSAIARTVAAEPKVFKPF